jgi:hypothetical protein
MSDDDLDDVREAFADERAERWQEFIEDNGIKLLREQREAEAWEEFVQNWNATH